ILLSDRCGSCGSPQPPMESAFSSPSPTPGPPPVRLVEPAPDAERLEALVESYRRLADTFHDVLAVQSLEALLERIADTLEALISVPLIARDQLKGALNVYRVGDDAAFTDDEFELVKRFGDAAALALDNAQIRERLELQAQTDSLTGLFNHRYFHDRLRAELQRVSRVHDSVAVLMFDIDDFKRVNDVHGHGTGDEILRQLAKTLERSVRGSDVVCRLGGE